MMKLKKVINFVVTLTLCFYLISKNTVSSYALTIPLYNTMDEIPEDINVFNTIALGRISAISINGIWYYQFMRSGYQTIRIKVSAFTSTAHQNSYLAQDNAALTKVVNDASTSRNLPRINYYVYSKKSKVNVTDKNNSMLIVDSYEVYNTSRFRSSLEVYGGTKDKVILKAVVKDFVKFTYSTKVVVDSTNIYRSSSLLNKYVAPANAYEYVKALKRSLVWDNIVPVIDLTITNTGNYSAFLSTYNVLGVGVSTVGIDVRELISVAYSSVSLVALATPSVGTLYALYKLINDANSLKLTSGVYNTGEVKYLSKGRNFVYRTKYTSPIKLVKKDNYFQTVTDFGFSKTGNLGTENKKLKIVFSFSH